MNAKVGRNDLCPCGSGKKYKKCCIADEIMLHRESLPVPPEAPPSHKVLPSKPNTPPDHEEPLDDEDEDEPGEPTKGDLLWNRFIDLNEPDPDELDEILSEMAALPEEDEEESMPWENIFQECAEWKSCDLERVFRKISTTVPHTKRNNLSFFYWQAAELFLERKEIHGHLLDEVVAGYCRLDSDSYDGDYLDDVLLILLEAGSTEAASKLAEHFLPIVTEDPELASSAVAEFHRTVFDIRVGRAIREWSRDSGVSVQQLADSLRLNLEDEVHEDLALAAAETITNPDQDTLIGWSRSDFDHLTTGKESWKDFVRLFARFVRMARENMKDHPPEKTVLALSVLFRARYEELISDKSKKGKKQKVGVENFLNCLQSSGIERRLEQSCPSILGGPDPTKTGILLEAHDILNQTALRHDLISASEAEKTENEVKRLRNLFS